MDFLQYYQKHPNFPYRYISPERLGKFLQANLSDYIRPIGTSVLGRPIYMLSLGTGAQKIIAWSQMHGNESNATHALLDLLESMKNCPDLGASLFSKIRLDFILQLNPDGAAAWTRRNALDIDINRDFIKESSKEILILKQVVKDGHYHYGLNLHEQRTIFTTDGEHPATLSFLAPSENAEREVTETRKKAMAVISRVYDKLNPILPHKIARYSDEFYPASTGDNFTKMGLPTILFEGGHYPDDYQRNGTRKFYTAALYEALKAMAELAGTIEGWEHYAEIPENMETHYDVIYRNVKLNTDFPCVLDVAVQYREVYGAGNDDISFVPIVMEVGDCSARKGWKEMDCTGKYFKSSRKYPKLDAEVDFEILDYKPE